MFEQLLQYSDWGLYALRLAVAVIFIYHAVPKLKGKMGQTFVFLGVVELVSGIGLILGVYVQLAALLLAVVMVGAIYMKIAKWNAPFSAHDKTGWEFDLILLAANLAILLTGGGSKGVF